MRESKLKGESSTGSPRDESQQEEQIRLQLVEVCLDTLVDIAERMARRAYSSRAGRKSKEFRVEDDEGVRETRQTIRAIKGLLGLEVRQNTGSNSPDET